MVSKMNLKGILVNTSQVIRPDTQLMLELKLNELEPILIKGYVHKISEDSANKKGMVIAFSNPSEEVRKKIQKFISDAKDNSAEVQPESEVESEEIAEQKKKSRWALRKKESDKKEDNKKAEKSKKPYEPNKTMIVGEDDLPSLSLSSPDNKSKISLATMDEESLHANHPGMGGSTRHVKLDYKQAKKKAERKPFQFSTIYKAFGFVLFMVAVVVGGKPLFKKMDTKFGNRTVVPQQSSTPSNTEPVANNPSTSKPTPDSPATNIIEDIQVEDQGSFIKISFEGQGNFGTNKVTKLPNPNRIHLELPDISDFKVPASQSYNNNPLAKINVSKKGNSLSVDLICTGVTAPSYEVKAFPNGLDVFIYR